jgi:hypothetical protein
MKTVDAMNTEDVGGLQLMNGTKGFDSVLGSAPAFKASHRQGLTLVRNSAQLELFCPPCNPSQLMTVPWSCSS